MSLLIGSFYQKIEHKEDDIHSWYEMVESTKLFPHENISVQTEKKASFGHALTYNTPEAVYELMPRYIPDHNLLFVSEGRIDNRDSLSTQLGIQGGAIISDGEYMLRAYLKWGKNAQDKLMGDWAFACYNLETEEVYIVRDHHGYTTIFYHFERGRFLFATSIKSLLCVNSINKRINNYAIIAELAIWKQNGDNNETIYKTIFLLPPAHSLTLKNGILSIERYWYPENTPINHYKNKFTYAEELLEILQKAVNARLRSYKPVASMLSGGLDSSSVSILAAEILAKQNKRLTTISHVPLYKEEIKQYKLPGRIVDESPYIDATVRASANIDSIQLSSEFITPSEGILRLVTFNDALFHGACNAYWLIDIYETTKRNGFGTLLSGEHGNAGISFTGLSHILPFNHPFFLLKPQQFIKSKLIRPLAYRYFKPWIKRYKLNNLENYIKHSCYLRQDIIQEWQILEDIRENSFSNWHSNSIDAQSGMLEILMVGTNMRCMVGSNANHFYGIELRDPTADKAVIEYCLSIPNDAFFDDYGNNKFLLKQMMRSRLPNKVLFEKRKGLQSADITFRVLSEQKKIEFLLNNFCENSIFEELIDIKKLRSDWRRLVTDKSYGLIPVNSFLKTLALGFFLRNHLS